MNDNQYITFLLNKRFLYTIIATLLASLSSCNTEKPKTELEILLPIFKDRIEKYFPEIKELPSFSYDKSITSNAIYKNDTVFVGNLLFSQDFLSQEDQLSILYHETNHFMNDKQKLYPCRIEEDGTIFQVMTDSLYEKPISPLEQEADLKSLITVNSTPEEIIQLKKATHGTVFVKFVYAPSNLAMDELSCYHSELNASKLGAFKLSTMYKSLLRYRIYLEQFHLKMRHEYELKNNLDPAGNSNKKR